MLSPDDLSVLCRAFPLASSTGVWPSQVLHDQPSEAGHFRPITVFSNVYRAWSPVVARHWLGQVSKMVDPWLCGGTSGGRAATIWRFVLEQVERAHRDTDQLCGFSDDVIKAFNVLPPTLVAAKLLGVDHGTLVAWAGALAGFKRHFVIQGNFSPGVDSVNGFPEGCAVSCLSMVVLTLDRYLPQVGSSGQPNVSTVVIR